MSSNGKLREMVFEEYESKTPRKEPPDIYRIVSWALILLVGFFCKYEFESIKDSIHEMQGTVVNQGQAIAKIQATIEARK